MATALVDSTKLDACCTAEANAIRAKTGSSSPIAYDWANSKGFADAIAAISGGGGDTLDDLLAESITAFRITDPNITTLKTRLQQYKTVATFYSTRWTSVNSAFTGSLFSSIVLIPPNANSGTGNNFNNGNTSLTICDFGPNLSTIGSQAFANNTAFNILILRSLSVVNLTNINAFTTTPFGSGGAGGTIYIPESLYGHLGDTGIYDYKQHSLWHQIDDYGTITWASIKNTYYETHYADGTPI